MIARTIIVVADTPLLLSGFRDNLFPHLESEGYKLVFYFPYGGLGTDGFTDSSVVKSWRPHLFHERVRRISKEIRSSVKHFSSSLFISFGYQANLIASRLSGGKKHSWIANFCGREGFPSTYGIKGRIALRKIRRSYKKADQLICMNRDDASFLRNHQIASSGKLTVIPGAGIHPDCEFPECEKNSSRTVFLMAGRLCPEKGVREYAEAASRLRFKFPDAEFRLQGQFEQVSGSPAEVLRRWDRSGVLRYQQDTTNLSTSISEADVFVFPSYNGEGMPDSLLTSLAMGKPLITTDHPGCKDAVESGRNGELVPVKDVDALTSAITKMIRIGSQARKVMGNYSREKAIREFNAVQMQQKYLHIINSCFPLPN